ncbi:MAG: extracellular solute-binding protein [Rhodocyclaceae bacterium]|nr:extracellular solute-binding protein [Rhodocyclaceae bacterium]
MAAGAQEVTLRHALEGRSLDALATLVVRFNDEQKGKAKVVIEDVHGVADKHRLPDMALLDAEDGMAFFGTLPRFRPLAQVMKEGGEKFDAARFYPQVADAVDDLTGKIQALPLGLALPVLFYDRDAFRKAGLDPDVPPQTWWEVQKAASALYDAGYKCPLTSSYFSWIHIENLSSQHGEPVVAKNGRAEKLVVNGMVNVKHIALLSSWYKSFYFHYFGPGNEGDAKFAAGECAMLTGESAAFAGFVGAAKFAVGVAALPHYDDVWGVKPNDVLPDGAALWILPGKKKPEYKVVARFVAFLLRPEIQKEWVRATGYLPMTPAAMESLRAAGMAPGVVAAAEKRLSSPRQGYRAKVGAGRNRIRAILDEEIAFVWQNTKPAKEALDTAVSRANLFLSPAVAAPRHK